MARIAHPGLPKFRILGSPDFGGSVVVKTLIALTCAKSPRMSWSPSAGGTSAMLFISTWYGFCGALVRRLGS